jgi:UDPglucose 6-dehydrogenase
VLVTEWNAFRSLDLARLKSLMASPILVDLRNVYRGRDVEAAGFAYSSIGRPGNMSVQAPDSVAAE